MQGEVFGGGWDDDVPWPDAPTYDPEPDVSYPATDPVGDAIDWTRTRNAADGQVALSILAELRATSPTECLSARELVAAEFGPALGLGSGAATKLVDTTIALHSRLRATFAAVCAGELSWYKASILVERTAPLTDEQARAVQDKVLPGAAGRTPSRFLDTVRRAVDRIDPHGADARRRQAKADVKLIRAHHGDGIGVLFARIASEQLDTVWTGADLCARNRKADGDPRTLDQLRVAALVQWAQSYLHHGHPSYCDQWCTPGSHGTPLDDTDSDAPDDDAPDDDAPDDDAPDDDAPDDDAP
jgi:hypothetical protein